MNDKLQRWASPFNLKLIEEILLRWPEATWCCLIMSAIVIGNDNFISIHKPLSTIRYNVKSNETNEIPFDTHTHETCVLMIQLPQASILFVCLHGYICIYKPTASTCLYAS